MNRKLIRPTLSEVQDQIGARMQRRKPVPPEQTSAENFYYIKQMQNRTPMIVVLDDGETFMASSSGTTRAASRCIARTCPIC